MTGTMSQSKSTAPPIVVTSDSETAPQVDQSAPLAGPTTGFNTLPRTRQILLTSTMACAGLLNIFTVQSTVIMLPSIGAALNIPTSRQQMITSVYNISSGCLILLWGRLADVYGRRVIFLIGSALFTLSTLVTPFSPNEICFYVFRALQGVSGAATVPSALGILATMFPLGSRQRTQAFVTFSAASSVGSVLGNLAGGVIGGFLSWKWVFWIPAMLASLVTTSAYVLAPSPAAAQKRAELLNGPSTDQDNGRVGEKDKGSPLSVDWSGGFLITATLTLLLVALSEANVVGWSTPWIPALIILSAMLGAIFVIWERWLEQSQTRHGGTRALALALARQPLIKVSLFRSPQFSAAFITIGCFYASFNSFLIFATFFYQDYLGLSVLQTTLRFLPAGIVGFVACFFVAPAIAAVPGFHLLGAGLACGIISPLLFALPVISPSTTYWAYGFPAMFLCVSADVVWPVVGLFVSQSLPEADQSLGGAMLQTSNNVGRALGLAVATAVQTAAQGAGQTTLSPGSGDLLRGIRGGQWTNVGLTLVAMTVTVTVFRGLGKVSK